MLPAVIRHIAVCAFALALAVLVNLLPKDDHFLEIAAALQVVCFTLYYCRWILGLKRPV